MVSKKGSLKMSRKIFFLVVACAMPQLVLAGGEGTTGADILAVEMGARPLSMGGGLWSGVG